MKNETEKAEAASLGAFLAGGSKNPTVNAALPAVYDELRELAVELSPPGTPGSHAPTDRARPRILSAPAQSADGRLGNRLQFLSIAARMMRRILADYAVARAAQKRGSGEAKLQLDAGARFL